MWDVRVWGRQKEDNQTETDDKDNSSDTLFISTKYFSNSHETNQEWWQCETAGFTKYSSKLKITMKKI